MRLLIAGGGTGGHIYPALAVADSLRRRPNPPDLGWIGGHRGLEDRIVRTAGIPLRRLALRSLRTVDRDVHLVTDPARLALSVPQALAILARDRPAAIFTTGGYVAIPVLIAASVLRIPVLLWEGNVTPGRSVRATAGLASAIAVSFAATCPALGVRPPCLETG
ncbi:MAG TPA: glycosyltransferase, partial [Candidatus Limnocylindrales bacterium]|nr:glycosyltransferase [Candidatus Limnocylindrales bacterium]